MKVKSMLRRLILQEWNIGFIETPIEDVIAGHSVKYKWMKHSFKGRWFADPFLLYVNDQEYVVLVEDFEDSRGYAVLSKLIVDRKTCELKSVDVILDVGTHLSYPFIIRKNGEVYVMPENSASGALYMYRMSEHGALVDKTLVIDQPLTDATLLDGGNMLLFTTKIPNPNGDTLLIYELKNGKYELVDNIQTKGRIARMGGAFFRVGGELYRPAQDCNDCYGGALIIQKISGGIGNWNIENVVRLTSEHPKLKTGLHTLNVLEGISVVDVHGYVRHPRLSKFATIALNKFRSLK